MKKIFLMLTVVAGIASAAMAQDGVRKADVMYKKELIRAVDLREPQNKPLFSRNREITSVLINAVMAGKITPYTNDSLTQRLSLIDFKKKMSMPGTEALPTDTAEMQLLYPDNWREMMANPPQADLYLPKDLYQMEIKEDIYFDKERSKLEYNIKALTVYVPADHPANIKGIQDPVASFDYKELEKFFKENPTAIHFNPQNDAQHKNLADAFELRLFSSYIIKVSNADDQYLSDIYKDQSTGIMASQWASYELMEYEHNLWEF